MAQNTQPNPHVEFNQYEMTKSYKLENSLERTKYTDYIIYY